MPLGNMFVQGHIDIKQGKVTSRGGKVPDGTYHVILGLERKQGVVWSDKEAIEEGIKPKRMFRGMTLKEKSKEW